MSQLEKFSFLFKDHFALQQPQEAARHLREAITWLYRAQDATADRGVSHSYLIGTGWMRSYPETTGYIIPTLLNWYRLTGEAEAKRRALEMADWELTIQLANGAIPALSNGEPVVFDTGQVLFGWLNAHTETGDPKYLDAAIRGGNWLLDNLDDDHTWRKYGNPGASDPNLYNVRFALALFDLTTASGDTRYRCAVEKFIDWVLAEEEAQGWFRYNCLTDNEHPLLHTIAYTAQGLLEAGVTLNDQRCRDAVVRTADALVCHIGADGRMPGRYGSSWQPAVSWSCLTGMAQMAIVWQRLDQLQGGGQYRPAAQKVLQFLKRTQDLKTTNLGVRGGIKGSYPVNGGYGTYRLLNWAAKFYIDALLLEEYPDLKLPLY